MICPTFITEKKLVQPGPCGYCADYQVLTLHVLGYYKITIHRRNSMLGSVRSAIKPCLARAQSRIPAMIGYLVIP